MTVPEAPWYMDLSVTHAPWYVHEVTASLPTGPGDDALEEWIGQVRYKPGWQFDLVSDHTLGDWALMVSAPVPNAYADDPATTWTRITSVHRIPKEIITTEDQFVDWLRHVVIGVEVHEVDEFLRFKGVQVRDPHPKS
jgi:hypothetical protein